MTQQHACMWQFHRKFVSCHAKSHTINRVYEVTRYDLEFPYKVFRSSIFIILSKQVFKTDFIFEEMPKVRIFFSFCKRLKPEGEGDKIPKVFAKETYLSCFNNSRPSPNPNRKFWNHDQILYFTIPSKFTFIFMQLYYISRLKN